MTFREKLADVISGGAVSEAIKRAAMCGLVYKELDERNARELNLAQDSLRKIIAMETPNMAHIGKRMVAVAKEGLGE